MKSTLVMTDLDRYSFVDILKIFITNPERYMYEINSREEPGELPYYRHALKTRKELKKTKAIFSFEGLFLEEFYLGKIRSYIFEELTTYQFFRLNDKIYSIEDGCPAYSEFFKSYEQLPCYTVEILTDLPEKFKPTTDFVVFKPQKDLFDIKVFEKLTQKVY